MDIMMFPNSRPDGRPSGRPAGRMAGRPSGLLLVANGRPSGQLLIGPTIRKPHYLAVGHLIAVAKLTSPEVQKTQKQRKTCITQQTFRSHQKYTFFSSDWAQVLGLSVSRPGDPENLLRSAYFVSK